MTAYTLKDPLKLESVRLLLDDALNRGGPGQQALSAAMELVASLKPVPSKFNDENRPSAPECYRIVTNGLEYHIQVLSRQGLIFKRWEWVDLGTAIACREGYAWTPSTYTSLQAAQRMLAELRDKAARRHPWRPVPESQE